MSSSNASWNGQKHKELVAERLGIFTLVSGLNIFLASTHQITSVLLVFSALNLYYIRSK